MRKGLTIALLAGAAAALGACSKQQAQEQNVAMDINQADPSDIETVPSAAAAPASSAIVNPLAIIPSEKLASGEQPITPSSEC